MLAFEVWDAIFDSLSIQDLLSISLTCSHIRVYVKLYFQFSFNFPKLLCRFIAAESVLSFRTLLQMTGGIISGSAALQCFDRRTFQSTNLDIYVDCKSCTNVVEWLLFHGF